MKRKKKIAKYGIVVRMMSAVLGVICCSVMDKFIKWIFLLTDGDELLVPGLAVFFLGSVMH